MAPMMRKKLLKIPVEPSGLAAGLAEGGVQRLEIEALNLLHSQ